MIFFKISFGYFFTLFFILLIAVNEVNNKLYKFDPFGRKNSHVQGVSSALEMIFKLPAFFKEFKDLQNP